MVYSEKITMVAKDSKQAGIDEAGRGSWAGPVTVAAVILNPKKIPTGLADSKTLSKKRREALFDAITQTSQVCVVHIGTHDIEQLNILQATLKGMREAIIGLPTRPTLALIDGNQMPKNLPCPAQTIIKGDSKFDCIKAASIVAKVSRDRLMAKLAQDYPQYGWEKNAGYGTNLHHLALQDLGVTPHHRRLFKPIHKIVLLSGAG